jgi:hypothetical protein
MNKFKRYSRLTVAGLATAAALLLTHDGVRAADHAEAPGTALDVDNAADIADVYAWHTEDGKLVAVLDFAGRQEAGTPPTYDLDVLYGIHIDNNADNMPDIDIWCRFGTNMAMDEFGVQCLNIPGTAGPVEGPVETNIDGGGGVMLYAGSREDPFFFDLEGYQMTLMSGMVMFDNTRDFFAGLNVTSIVLEMDAAMAAGGGTQFQLWATTGRLAP